MQVAPEGTKDLFKMACVVSDMHGAEHPAVKAAWVALNSLNQEKIDAAYEVLETLYVDGEE
jgi:hypothetical protein